MVRRFSFLVACIIFLLTASSFGQAPVRYIYDELGRLVGVIDSNGESAIYHYDPVGNLLAITRAGSTDVSIIEFTPNGGPIGQTVTLYGTGFSATAGQNAVSFNGTAATVTSATTTTLVVTVPAGASTGPISVTSPNGSANSGTDFVVGAPGAPSIVSFTPAAGIAGTTVTITGTNFDTVLANNRTRFNASRAGLSDGTDTTLTTTVPAKTGSGRIEVNTPLGTAISADDFIIPPSPYVPADVFASGRISLGVPTVVSVSTSSKIALQLFDGTPGQRVSILGTNGVAGQILGCDMPVSLLNPDATLLGGPTCMEGSGFMDTKTLATAGTYTILADPGGAATGSVTLRVYDVPPDFTAVIEAGGDSVTASMSTPGQNASLTFAGTAGQRVSVRGTNGISGQISLTCDVEASILNPNGSELAAPRCMEGSGFIDVTTLPATASYRIFVDPTGAATGNLTLTLYEVPADFTASINADGSPVAVPITTPGQNATLTFTGTAGQRVSMTGTGTIASQVQGCDVDVSILDPNNDEVADPTCMEGSGYTGFMTLPATGTYTVFVNPLSSATGNLTLRLYEVIDFEGTITPGGSALTVELPTPGQNGHVTFTGTSGQRISLRGTNALSGQVIGCDLRVSILKPDTSELVGPTCMEGSGYIDVRVLPDSGTYTILVDPIGVATGNITLTLYDVPADTTGTVSIGGSAVAVPLGTPGQNGTLTFAGTSGQQVTVRMTGNTFGSTAVRLLRPDGSQLTTATSSGANFNLATQTLPVDGTYTIVIDPAGANTGTINVTVTNP